MELSTDQLHLVIGAVRDAITLTRGKIEEGKEDVTDLEEYLLQLGNLDAELKIKYEKLRARNKKLIAYDLLVGERFRKL